MITMRITGMPSSCPSRVCRSRSAWRPRARRCEKHQFDALGIDWDDYDVIVVKQGYIFPDLKAKGQLCIMSLTDGATPQDTASIPFKQIQRPMFPIDEI